jgi:hypothetical protein
MKPKLPRRIAGRLKTVAERSSKTQSRSVPDAPHGNLEGNAIAGSVLEIAGDVVGSLEGPRDLGSASKHLRGLGRP